MRTPMKDSGPTIFATFILNAASGSGVFYPDLRYTFTRTATGIYAVRFDTQVVPVSLTVTAITAGYAFVGTALPGTLDVRTFSDVGVTAANQSFRVVMSALDKRI